MSNAKQSTKRKRNSRAGQVLAAGLSLSVVSGASAATGADTPTRNTGVSDQVALYEEEISDVTLATFYVFDKEGAAKPFRRGVRLAGGGGCGCGRC